MAVWGIRCVSAAADFKLKTFLKSNSGLVKLYEAASQQSRHMELIISQPADFILRLYYESLQLKRDDKYSNEKSLIMSISLQRCLC